MLLNKIYNGDCVKIMNNIIDSDSIDIVYSDPPYNLSGKSLNLINNKTGGAFYKMNEPWDTWEYKEYISFTREWIKSCYKILKVSGSLYISCTFHNIGEIIISAKDQKFRLNNVITWYKTNAMPNITKRVFTHSTEYICWFVKGKRWKFNYEELKRFHPHKTKTGEHKQMRDIIDFIETPILQGKERIKSDIGRAAHPTQKPEKLIELILTASSEQGDLVLDPFFGTGTTGVVAKKMNRNWIGIEIDKKYYDIAQKRLINVKDF